MVFWFAPKKIWTCLRHKWIGRATRAPFKQKLSKIEMDQLDRSLDEIISSNSGGKSRSRGGGRGKGRGRGGATPRSQGGGDEMNRLQYNNMIHISV